MKYDLNITNCNVAIIDHHEKNAVILPSEKEKTWHDFCCVNFTQTNIKKELSFTNPIPQHDAEVDYPEKHTAALAPILNLIETIKSTLKTNLR